MSDDLQTLLASLANNQGAEDEVAEPGSNSNSNAMGTLEMKAPLSSLDLEEMSVLQPQTTPITRMESNLSKLTNGRLIAVNENYICYAIKGNLIRCIHFIQVTRNKLAEHPAPLVDIEFAGHQNDTLASLDVSGVLRIRKIYEENNQCQYSTEIEAQLPVTNAQRVRWGPPNSNVLALACDNNVVLVNYQTLINNADSSSSSYPTCTSLTNLSEIGSICNDIEGNVTDMTFSPDYKFILITSYEYCKLFHTNYTSNSTSSNFAAPNMILEYIGSIPTTSKTLCSARFIGFNSILTASANNRVLQLWQPSASNQSINSLNPINENNFLQLEKQHEVLMEADSEITPWTNISIDSKYENIILATTNCLFFNVIHLKKSQSGSSSSFDRVTKWECAHPILSFTTPMTPSNNNNGDDEDEELNLFCIQTKAIQKYTIKAKDYAPAPSLISSLSVPEGVSESVTPDYSGAINDLAALLKETQPSVVPLASPCPPPPPPPESMSPRSNTSQASSSPQAAASTSRTSSTSTNNINNVQNNDVQNNVQNKNNNNKSDMLEMENRLLKGISKMMDEKLKNQRQVISKEIDNKINKMSEILSKNLHNSINTSIEQRTKKYHGDLENKIKQTITTTTTTQTNQLTQSLNKDSNKMKDELIKTVLKDIQKPIQESFRECFLQLLVPSLESGTQNMFNQIDKVLNEKLTSASSSSSSSSGSGGGGGGGESSSSFPPLDAKEEIQICLDNNQLNEAMMLALGSQDLELVDWLCNKLNAEIIHEGKILSQTVLLCLLQQLGYNLEINTLLKLTWLKEISLNMDPNNSEIISYVPKVVNDLKTKVKAFQLTDAGRQVRTELSLILRVLP